MIDSHCHLTAKEFDADRDQVIERAFGAGVTQMITISDEMSDIKKCQNIARKYEHIYYSVGVHPHHAKDFDSARDASLLIAAAKDPKCRAIGEIGLDYHYMHPPSPGAPGLRRTSSEKDTQQRVFEAQLNLAKELDLPAIVHCREASEDVWTIVHHVKPQKLVIHCCTEKWGDVQRFVDAGYLVSFTGIVTYPKAEDIRETVRQCPLSSMMVETDAPFLAPVPYRGKRCEPVHVMDTAKMIAEIKQISLEELDRVTTQNAIEFFRLLP